MKTARHKRNHYRRNRLILCLGLVIALFGWWVHSFNEYMEPRLQAIAKQNVVFAINNITQSVLTDLEYDPQELIHTTTLDDGTIVSIEYDSYRLNQILYTALNTIDESLEEEDDRQGHTDGDEIYFKNGVEYECPLGLLTKIPFLANWGPRIPIRLKLLNDVTGEVKVDSTPYGINNTLVRVSMKVSVKTQVITLLSASEMETSTEIPIVVQIVNGKIPQISPYYSLPEMTSTDEK